MERPLAITNHNICMKCLKAEVTKEYRISNRGYFSNFDCINSKFQVCDSCDDEVYDDWFNEDPKLNKIGVDSYDDGELNEFIHSLPLQGQELFFNTFNENADKLDPQTWIDVELGLIKHPLVQAYLDDPNDEVDETMSIEEEIEYLKQVIDNATNRLNELLSV